MGEENTMGTEQQTADQQDAFLAGWGEGSNPEVETEDQAAEGSEAQSGAEAASEAAGAETAGGEKPEAEDPTAPGDETGKNDPAWVVKHMGAERTIKSSEVTPELLQKGLDYDRVRAKYDEAKPVLSMFTDFARQAGMSVPDYVKHIRAEAKKATGMSDADAKLAVDLEDREAAVSAKETAQQVESGVKAQREARIKADLAEFSKAFPEVFEQAKSDPKVIPQSVWGDVKNGLTLTTAYSKYAVAQARAEAQSAREGAAVDSANRRNAQRSTGSMQSAGQDKKSSDPFLAGFDG